MVSLERRFPILVACKECQSTNIYEADGEARCYGCKTAIANEDQLFDVDVTDPDWVKTLTLEDSHNALRYMINNCNRIINNKNDPYHDIKSNVAMAVLYHSRTDTDNFRRIR
ncbi:hypothetical protein [Priestia koreensis]|uniref:hypothetical protein n=1 Tax=Priestia koreensis TaxID=284581 RepID=UPI001F58E29D|nr:hypothetical protein [Priestia koreensis]UNL87583.1 hypothetical protein IE339_24085 [Priestia koreensis]